MQLTDVTLSYGNKVVASGINATLAPGRIVCLVGRNGAGKSTLIRYMASLGSQGEVAIVLTDRIDVDNMTARMLVGMGRMPYTGFFGRLSAKDHEIVDDAMQMLGISDLADREVTTLSDGERQKVMIAKALAQQTPCILLDEPTAFLDYPTKVETMRMLQRLSHEEGKAILISTHDLDTALRHCDEVWEMAGGTMRVVRPEEFIVYSS